MYTDELAMEAKEGRHAEIRQTVRKFFAPYGFAIESTTSIINICISEQDETICFRQ